MAIKSFTHKGLKRFHLFGDTRGIIHHHTTRLEDILGTLEASHELRGIRAIFSWQFQEKRGSDAGVYSIQVNGNWRVTFELESDGAVLLNYCDYHGKTIRAIR